jgi:hypothetical protein
MPRKINAQDISWFLDLNTRNQVDLDPPYQRRSVWTLNDRRFFLDTIFNSFPSPAVFLHKTIDSKGTSKYHVVDGKQRLETIFLFAANKIALSKEISDTRLAGKKWKQIHDEDLKRIFWNYEIIVEMVDTVQETIVDEIFARVNRNSRKLERQELRHAKYDGWFINIVETEAEHDDWRQFNIVTTSRAKRMKDIQFLSELFFLVLDNKIVGFDQDYLDKKYAEYETPQETQTNFSEEDFKKTIAKLKKYLLKMDAHNSCIQEYGKSFTNFYSLWALIALNYKDLPKADDTADIYTDFMRKVETLSSLSSDQVAAKAKSKGFKEPYNYYQYSIGATTDSLQREQRDLSLKSAFGL